jgi:hypothetical protein
MASDMTARYVAEAQASTSSGTEQRQSIRGGYYAAQAQLDHKATREISRVPHTAPRAEGAQEKQQSVPNK